MIPLFRNTTNCTYRKLFSCSNYPTAGPEFVLTVRLNIAAEQETEFNQWYNDMDSTINRPFLHDLIFTPVAGQPELGPEGLVLGVGPRASVGDPYAADPPVHAFVGAEKCGLCHSSTLKGAQYTKWTSTRHSKAYATLASEEAKKVAASKGIANPLTAAECLKCHVTGYGAPADRLGERYRMEEGVTCESCHGPGGDYSTMEVMKDHDRSVAAGMSIATEETCRGCHNPESPTHTGFDFASAHQEIAHLNPRKGGK